MNHTWTNVTQDSREDNGWVLHSTDLPAANRSAGLIIRSPRASWPQAHATAPAQDIYTQTHECHMYFFPPTRLALWPIRKRSYMCRQKLYCPQPGQASRPEEVSGATRLSVPISQPRPSVHFPCQSPGQARSIPVGLGGDNTLNMINISILRLFLIRLAS